MIFPIFGTMVGNSNIENLTEPFIPGNFLAPIWAKGLRMGPKQDFWDILKNFVMLIFLGNNL